MTPQQQAEELLPCSAGCRKSLIDPLHYAFCQANNRPAVAAALAQRDTEIAIIKQEQRNLDLLFVEVVAKYETLRAVNESLHAERAMERDIALLYIQLPFRIAQTVEEAIRTAEQKEQEEENQR